jgi:DNA polymerase III alpha subunit
MAFVTLEDGNAEIEATAFPRVLEAAGELIGEDALVGMSLSAGTRNGELNLIIEEVFPLDDVSRHAALSVTLKIDGTSICQQDLDRVLAAVGAHPGEAPVRIEVVDPIGSIVVLAGDRFHVAPGEPLREALAPMSGILGVSFGNGNRP